GSLGAGCHVRGGQLMLLGLLDHIHEGLDLAEGFGAAPHEDPVYVPVAAFEGAAFEVVDGLAEDEGAGDEVAADEGLAADIDGLVEEGFAFVFGEEHGLGSPEIRFWGAMVAWGGGGVKFRAKG